MKKYFLLFFLPFISFGQISNQVEVLGRAPLTDVFLATQKDSKGNEYILFTDFNNQDSTYTFKIQKFDKDENKVFAGNGLSLKTIPYNKSAEFYNYFDGTLQLDSLENMYVFLTTPSLDQPSIDSIYSDVNGFKIDKIGNRLWGNNGKNIAFHEANAHWRDGFIGLEVITDGSLHLFRTSSLGSSHSIISYFPAIYYKIDKDGNEISKNIIPNKIIDSSFISPIVDFIPYKVYKDKNGNINFFHFWNNSASGYKIQVFQYNTSGLISEYSISGTCDSASVLDMLKFDADIFFRKKEAGINNFLKLTENGSFENTPTLSLEGEPFSIIKKGEFYFYTLLNTNLHEKYIQKVDLQGNKKYGVNGFEMKESYYTSSRLKRSKSTILVPKDDGSLMVLNSAVVDTINYDIAISFMTFSSVNLPIIYPEQRLLLPCGLPVFEIPGDAYNDPNSNSFNLYLEEGNTRELRRINFLATSINNCNIYKSNFCVPFIIIKK